MQAGGHVSVHQRARKPLAILHGLIQGLLERPALDLVIMPATPKLWSPATSTQLGGEKRSRMKQTATRRHARRTLSSYAGPITAPRVPISWLRRGPFHAPDPALRA